MKTLTTRRILILSSLLSCFSLLFLFSCSSENQNYEEGQGTILELKDNGRVGKGMRSYMVVKYTDKSGTEQTGELDYDPLTKSPEVNEQVKFRYDPQKPTYLIEEDSFYNKLTSPTALIFILFLLYGLYWLYTNVLRSSRD